MSRDHVLHQVRTALGRSVNQPPAAPPAVRIRYGAPDVETRIATMFARVEALAGKTYLAASLSDARDYAARLVEGRKAVASNAPFLATCGITEIPGVASGFVDAASLRETCAAADVGITSAEYALADTGTLAMISSREQARLISLLPLVHLAVVPASRILTGLDELLERVPLPADRSSSMVLITGPSRTADIEQILVRGVHGPGEIHVVVVS